MVGSVFPHGPVFRPSETKDWSRCPTLWWYKYVEGWQPPLDTWSPERDMGTALHAGMRTYWEGVRACQLGPNDVTREIGETLEALWPLDAPEEYSKGGMHELMAQCGIRMSRWFVQHMGEAEPVLIEHPLGEDGHTTPDLVTREGGELVVTDLKYHHYVPADRINQRFEHLDRDHQFQMYPWAVSEYLGEPVRRFRKLGVIGLPKIVIRAETFEITPEGQAAWLEGARRKWHEMDRMLKGGPGWFVYQRQEGCRPYGDKYPCPMEQACWTCYGDRIAMKKFYTQREETR